MKPNRRQFVRKLGTSSAGIALGAGIAANPQDASAAPSDGPALLVGDKIALTQTEYGPVRGYVLRGIHYFLGMRYGADTSGS